MDVVFIYTSSSRISTVPVVNGQVIALTDADRWMYDLNNTRHTVGSGSEVTPVLTDGTSIATVGSGASAQSIFAPQKEVTQAQLDALIAEGTIDNTIAYFVTDGESGGGDGNVAKASITITSAGWSANPDSNGYYTQTLTLTGATATTPIINAVVSSSAANFDAALSDFALIVKFDTVSGGIQCFAKIKPTVDIPCVFYYMLSTNS